MVSTASRGRNPSPLRRRVANVVFFRGTRRRLTYTEQPGPARNGLRPRAPSRPRPTGPDERRPEPWPTRGPARRTGERGRYGPDPSPRRRAPDPRPPRADRGT